MCIVTVLAQQGRGLATPAACHIIFCFSSNNCNNSNEECKPHLMDSFGGTQKNSVNSRSSAGAKVAAIVVVFGTVINTSVTQNNLQKFAGYMQISLIPLRKVVHCCKTSALKEAVLKCKMSHSNPAGLIHHSHEKMTRSRGESNPEAKNNKQKIPVSRPTSFSLKDVVCAHSDNT